VNRNQYLVEVNERLVAQGFEIEIAPTEIDELTHLIARQEVWGVLYLGIAPFEGTQERRHELVDRCVTWARSQSEQAGSCHLVLVFPSETRVDPAESTAILDLKQADEADGRWSVLPWSADVEVGLVDQHSGFPKVDSAVAVAVAEPPKSGGVDRPRMEPSPSVQVARSGLHLQNVPVTRVILAGTVAYYLWVLLVGESGFALVRGPGVRTLLQWGANHGQLVLVEGQTWRLFTHILLHGGLMHLAFNMWALWWLGRYVELLYGSWRMALIYLAAGVAGGLASTVLRPSFVPSVGASGAVLGLLGALLYFSLAVPGRRMDWRELMVPVVINLMYGLFLPGIIDNYAHFGGFGAGLAAAALAGVPGQRSSWQLYASGALLLFIALTLVGAVPLAHLPLFG